jgi:siroheme synthase (precorrin-2 oxidase/ferrochelatase)
LVPLADSEYSYYAPLGVLISMYPTVVGSARAGLQALIGLTVGIVLGLGALLLVSTGAAGVVAVASVIAIGIALGGITELGAGRDWIAIAGLFVLLVGGPAGEEFTLSYLFTTAFGVLVGVAMNLIVVPPLYLRRAGNRLTGLRDRVRGALEDIADAVAEQPIDGDRLARATDGLPAMLSSVENEVHEADESTRANPRGRRRTADRALNTRRMSALARTSDGARDLAIVLIQAADEGEAPDAATSRALADAVRACADIVGAATDDPEADAKLARAADAADAVLERLTAAPIAQSGYGPAYAYTAAVCLRRIVLACDRFVAHGSPPRGE